MRRAFGAFINRAAVLAFALAVLVAVAMPLSAAQVSTQDFQAANRLYEEGKFQEAAQSYQKLIDSGVRAPALFFNLGNAWFKTAQVGRAIAAYRKAAELAPRDPDIIANLQFARNRVQGPTLLPAAWEKWLARLTLNEWTTVAACSVWLLMGMLAVGELRPLLKPRLRGAVLASLGVALAGCGCVGASLATENSSESGVLIASESPVRLGPLEESPVSFRLQDGAEVEVIDRRDNWVQVSTGPRRTGWVHRNEIALFR